MSTFEFGDEFEFTIKRWMRGELSKRGVKGDAVYVYAWLYRSMKQGKPHVDVSYSNIMQLLGTSSRDTATKILKKLEEAGVVAIERRGTPGHIELIGTVIGPAERLGFADRKAVGKTNVENSFADRKAVGKTNVENSFADRKAVGQQTEKRSANAAKAVGKDTADQAFCSLSEYKTEYKTDARTARTPARAGKAGQKKQKKAVKKAKVQPSHEHGWIAPCPSPHKGFAYEIVVPGDSTATCDKCGTTYDLDWSSTGVRQPKPAIDYSDHPDTLTCASCGAEGLRWDEARHGFDCPACGTFNAWRGKPM